jgi:23S rRNA (uracil1939-C5)-methyltransferase
VGENMYRSNEKSILVKTKAVHYDRFGRGVIQVGKYDYSVFNLIPEEEATIKVQGEQGKVQTLISKSDLRVIPPCRVYDSCGSCQLQHLHYKEQLNFKANYVKETFEANEISITLEPIIAMDKPYRYRNKNQFSYGFDKAGNIITGLFEEHSHKLVLVNDCLIQDQVTNELFHSIKDIMQEMKIYPFKEDVKKGIIRYVLIKRGFKTDQTLVTIVTSVESFPGKNEFFKAIIKKNPHISTLVQNINSRKTSVILGDIEKVIYGKGYIEDTLLNLTFQISSKSFYQINPVQTEKLYQKVIEYASLTGSETVIDTYSGIGTIGLVLAKYAKQVYCVELNKDAHYDAIRNAKYNKIQNVQCFNQDATQFMISLSREKVSIDVVIMDPTRNGSTPEFINAVAILKPKKVVYVSCEPSTQARDIRLLIDKGYVIQKAVPVDMFPQTYHVESIVLLHKK